MTERDWWTLGAGSLLVLVLSVLALHLQRRRLVRQGFLPVRRFEALARSIPIADPAVAACWVYVMDAVKTVSHADDLLLALTTGASVGYDEFGIEIEGDEVAVWSGLGETLRCSRAGLAAALSELSERAKKTLPA